MCLSTYFGVVERTKGWTFLLSGEFADCLHMNVIVRKLWKSELRSTVSKFPLGNSTVSLVQLWGKE